MQTRHGYKLHIQNPDNHQAWPLVTTTISQIVSKSKGESIWFIRIEIKGSAFIPFKSQHMINN